MKKLEVRERAHNDTIEEREYNKDTPGPENGPGKTKKAATKEKLEVRERDNEEKLEVRECDKEDNLTVREHSKDTYNPQKEEKQVDPPGCAEHCNIKGQDERAEQWSNCQDGSTSQYTHNTTQCPTKIGPVARYVHCPVTNKLDQELTFVNIQGTDTHN